MGWVSYFEDNLERLQDHIRSAEDLLQNSETSNAECSTSALKTLLEAKAILDVILQHLDLATSPELDAAYELNMYKRKISALEAELATEKQRVSKLQDAAAMQSKRLEASRKHVSGLVKDKRRVEKEFEKVVKSDFAAAVDVFSSPAMIKKHKPDA
jgi:uncharacterized coiled-coil protein SlyX